LKAIIEKPYGLLLLTAALLGVEAFVFMLLYDRGLLPVLFVEDYSFISRGILFLYLLASLHVVWIANRLSLEFDYTDDAHPRADGHVRRYFSLLREAPPDQGGESEQLLLAALEGRCRSGFSYGYVVADLMLKLGLLGTVIGFIFMLGSLTDLNSIDINVMQEMLGEMSGGMKVALFTTLTGMSCGVLLNMKYHLLDWSVDSLMDDVREQTYLNRAR
jgi:hypothetical protein